MKIKTAGLSDKGLKRETNEDSFAIDEDIRLFIVADGMGGHLAGEVASKVAVKVIQRNINRWISESCSEFKLYDFPDKSLSTRGNYVVSSIKLANRVIHEMANAYDEYKGMGTTVGVITIMFSSVIAANVGDSGIYLIRGESIEPLFKEHSLVTEQLEMGLITEEEAAVSPLKHILTRNLGSAESVEVDVFEIEPLENDRFLLCTDGLTDLLSENEILDMVKSGDDPDELCRQLVSEANRRGGHDNITVSLVFVNELDDGRKGILKKIKNLLKK